MNLRLFSYFLLTLYFIMLKMAKHTLKFLRCSHQQTTQPGTTYNIANLLRIAYAFIATLTFFECLKNVKAKQKTIST